MEKQFSISLDGTVSFIYSDEDRDLFEEGAVSISRVSSVEPIGEKGEWLATMIDGAILGPFKLRQDALEAEVKYIKENLL